MNNEFAISGVDVGRLNALVKNAMKQTGESDPNEAVRLVNSGEWIFSRPVRRWTVDKDGVIRFSVTGLGLTGKQWIDERLEKGHKLSKRAEEVLLSPNFVSCEVGKVYNIVVLPGVLFSDENRTTKNIRDEGDRRGLPHGKNLPTEIGCFVRENFTNDEIKQLDLSWLVTMHEPVEDSPQANAPDSSSYPLPASAVALLIWYWKYWEGDW